MRSGIRSRIGKRLLLYIILYSSVITLLLTAFQLHRDYQFDLKLIDQRMHQVEASSLSGLIEHLWKVDYAALALQLDGISKIPDIRKVTVFSPTGEIISSVGDQGEGAVTSRVFPMAYDYGEKKIELGSLSVTADLQAVYQRLYDKALVILFSQAIKTFLVSAFILFIVHHLITHHLTMLSQYVRKFSLDKSKPILLPEKVLQREDEIGDLLIAFAEMQGNLNLAFDQQRQIEKRFRRIFEGSNDAIFLLDYEHGVIVDCNQKASYLTGYTLSHLKGMAMKKLHPTEMSELMRFCDEVVLEHRGFISDLSCTTIRGDIVPVEISASLITIDNEQRILAMVRDQSERYLAEEKINYLAYHDSLTDLPNRTLLNDRLTIALARAKRYERRGSVLFLDLDNFKTVNDSLGHIAGDHLLKLIVKRLAGHLRENDTFARLGGDEFVVLFDGVSHERDDILKETEALANKLQEILKEPFEILDQQLYATVSIGIAIFPDDGETADEILRRADSAMYKAKEGGRDQVSIFTPQLEAGASRRLELQHALRQALSRNEYFLDIQPQIDLKTNKLCGAEALLRWRDPTVGVVRPDEFIPFLEESGLIVPVGQWVLRSACSYWKSLLDLGQCPEESRIAVNVSPRELLEKDYCNKVRKVLLETGLSAKNLELEITEQVVVDDFVKVVEKLTLLRDAGISLTIDDFGTGYSSLAYLHRLPVHTVKIDRSFVSRITDNADDASLIDNIIAMSHKLNLCVVAEGVETKAQRDFLLQNECDVGQGYLFGRPVAMVDFSSSNHSRPTKGSLKTESGSK